MAQAVQELFPEAKLGIGPPIENGFYYDFDVETPFVPEDLEKIETADAQDHQGGPAVLPAARSPTTTRSTELAGRALQARADRAQGRPVTPRSAAEGASVEVGAGELTIYDNLRRDGELAWKDLCRGPHLPTTKRIPAFKLMRTRRGVLARRREEQAAPAHLRHRLGDQGGARGAPAPASRRPSGATTASSAASSTSLLPRRARLRPGGLPPQGRRDQAGDGGLRPAAAHRGGLRVRRHPAHLQGGAVPHLRAPAVLRRHACSRRWRSRARTTTSRR